MTTGRRAGYKIMKNANKYLCIDIGGTAIKYGIFTDETECLMKNQITTPPYMQEFTACMEDICSTAQKKYDKLCGVSVSVPGRVDKDGTLRSSGNLVFLKDYNLTQFIQKITGLPTKVENDGICAAIAEHKDGALKGCHNAIAVIFGTGIAGGIIINDKIFRGSSGSAAEFSFIVMGAGFFNEETLWAADNGDYMLRQLVGEVKHIPSAELDGRRIFEMADSGDEEVKIVIDNYTKIIARNLFNLQAVLDVEKIAVGGGIANSDFFAGSIHKNFDEYFRLTKAPFNKPQIVKCRFTENANMVGALVNFLKEE